MGVELHEVQRPTAEGLEDGVGDGVIAAEHDGEELVFEQPADPRADERMAALGLCRRRQVDVARIDEAHAAEQLRVGFAVVERRRGFAVSPVGRSVAHGARTVAGAGASRRRLVVWDAEDRHLGVVATRVGHVGRFEEARDAGKRRRFSHGGNHT